MKKYRIQMILLALLVFAGACKKSDPAIDVGQILTANLASTWAVSSVTFDEGVTEYRTMDFDNFTLTFDENKNYSTTNSANYGPFSVLSSGAWIFANEMTDINATSYQIVRNQDGLLMNVVISESSLTLTFNFVDNDKDGHNDGRDEGVTGEWVFQFTR